MAWKRAGFFMSDPVQVTCLHRKLRLYALGVSAVSRDVGRQITRAAEAIKAADAIAIVGAGASKDVGIPTLPELVPLLWQAIDAEPEGRRRLAAQIGSADVPAKLLIGDDPEHICRAYERVESSALMRETFQHAFSRLDADRSAASSPAHRALAELLHRGHVSHVISLNWDTMLESAHEDLYGRRLVAGVDPLTKPHGDAASPDIAWTLPNQPGDVSRPLLERLRNLVDARPRVLLIIGYSERDAAVVDQIISPLDDRWRVIRVGPAHGGPLDIAGRANDALTSLMRALGDGPELPGWEYVRFTPQRGIGPALLGEGLGPHEVGACPPLPEVAESRVLLEVAGQVSLLGGSGSGKSITCYQVAWGQSKSSWEVVRLAASAGSIDPSVSLRALRHRTVAVVDDAQTLPVDLVRHIQDRADPSRLRVIVVSTDEVGRGSVVRVAAERAVGIIAEALEARSAELTPILHQLDRSVGDGYLDESFKSRLERAARERTPWEFGFVLRGGWQEARSAIAALRDRERADLALAVVAACQLVTADRGVDEATLISVAKPLGRSGAWLQTSLQLLRKERRLLEGERPRTPHAAFARTVLQAMLSDRADPERDALTMAVREAIRGAGGDAPSIGGIAWIVNALTIGGDLPIQLPPVFDSALVDALVDRFKLVTDAREIGQSSAALNLLRRWGTRATERIKADPEWVARWVASVEVESASGLASMVNDLYNDERTFARRTFDNVANSSLIERILDSQPSQLWAWGQFISRLSLVAAPAGRKAIGEGLADPRVSALVGRSVGADMAATSNFIEAVSAYDHSLALKIVETNARAFAEHLNASPAEGFRECQDVLWFVLGFAPRFLTRHGPDRERKRVAALIADGIDTRRIAAAIAGAARRDWHDLGATMFFLRDANRRTYQAVLDAIEVDQLDQCLADYWPDPGAPLDEALHTIGWGKGHEPARTLITRHAAEAADLSARMAIFAPSALAAHIRSGSQLNLGIASGNWEVAVLALVALEAKDHELAVDIVESNLEDIRRGLESPQSSDLKAAAATLGIVQQLTASGFHRLLGELDPEKTATSLAAVGRKRTAQAGLAALLSAIADQDDGARIAERVRRLLRQVSPGEN
jgi:hypothetical protein